MRIKLCLHKPWRTAFIGDTLIWSDGRHGQPLGFVLYDAGERQSLIQHDDSVCFLGEVESPPSINPPPKCSHSSPTVLMDVGEDVVSFYAYCLDCLAITQPNGTRSDALAKFARGEFAKPKGVKSNEIEN